MTDPTETTQAKKYPTSILNKVMWLSAMLAAIAFMVCFPSLAGKIIGWGIAILYLIYCFTPKGPKTKNSHTITIKRG